MNPEQPIQKLCSICQDPFQEGEPLFARYVDKTLFFSGENRPRIRTIRQAMAEFENDDTASTIAAADGDDDALLRLLLPSSSRDDRNNLVGR